MNDASKKEVISEKPINEASKEGTYETTKESTETKKASSQETKEGTMKSEEESIEGAKSQERKSMQPDAKKTVIPPPPSESRPLPQPPSEPLHNLEPNRQSSTSETTSPDGDLRRGKRSFSLSDLATAMSKKVGSMAERAKKFFGSSEFLDSPNLKDDEREVAEGKRKKEWITILDKNPSRANMSTSRVNKLCWKGIPSSIRGRAWKAIIGNELKITPELFKINLRRGKRQWERQVVKPSKEPAGRHLEADDDSREDSMRIIQADIPRTFPQLKFFHKGGTHHEPLMEVLQSYVCYRPDVGYVQGMSYLAAILLLNMPTFDAFQCLANLLNQDIYFVFFRMDVNKMNTHLDVYQTLLKEKLPNLYKHFEEIEIKPGMYLYEWLLTIYSRSLKIDIAHRIWDNFLYHGQVFLFRTALGMLRLFEAQFLKMSFEDCLSILNRPPEDINENELFENIYRIQLTSKRFDRMVSKAMEEEKKKMKSENGDKN
eukprot:CAMPEP_0114525526 /NCGR_PEP_ID=MMETSP0109-20121206/22480_1 /TAXON_ID=29199 /ORGANISM="Chlorarachnion reptans, Strain CCCM449" /LENGTH=486 /DNA_ID=CAMNT_0001707131 /DNA_START=121 /DNA_END=1581 /DNA_ORIENTATION=+